MEHSLLVSLVDCYLNVCSVECLCFGNCLVLNQEELYAIDCDLNMLMDECVVILSFLLCLLLPR